MNNNGKRTLEEDEDSNLNDDDTQSGFENLINRVLDTNNKSNNDDVDESSTSEKYTKEFVTHQEFLTLTSLTNHQAIVESDNNTICPLENICITPEELIESFTENSITPSDVTEFLTSNPKVRKNGKFFYPSEIFEYLYYILKFTYVKKYEQYPILTEYIDLFLRILQKQKNKTPTILEDMRVFFKGTTKENIQNVTKTKMQLEKFLKLKFKRMKTEVIQEEPEVVMNIYQDLEEYFPVPYDDIFTTFVKPFMTFNWFFNGITPYTQVGFTMLSRGQIKIGKNKTPTTTLKLILNKPILCKVTSHIVKGDYLMLSVHPEAALSIVQNVRNAVRFKDATGEQIHLDYYEDISICNRSKASVYNLYEYNSKNKNTAWNANAVSNGNIYMLFDSIYLVYNDEGGKISLRLYPCKFHSNDEYYMINAPREDEEKEDEADDE
ncbi:DhNV_011 [Dikerogammarus haemobaphes nudivirus]|nr:DhNV_011 [Dikerogammarus haemobaphes nudivirus]